ncbi:hypothetical protein [Carnobacterium maltaromaticum]|uniref:hypothetical protein n=1 Tax=Carnobacterium maltaromaticum TaxID=2751 RepID=UPI00295F585F|nr:hypothetical protein [Carnobacterium maltaromaticum]
MSKIKIKSDEVIAAVGGLSVAVDTYENAVVKSQIQLDSALAILSGKGYNALDQQIQKNIDKQKIVVSECKILVQTTRQFLSDMENVESTIKFPQ